MKHSFLLAGYLFALFACHAQPVQSIDNLYSFARPYGYVRYFYPGDAAVVADWDKLAVYGARAVEKAGSSQALQRVLEQLFKPLAPSLAIYSTGSQSPFSAAAFIPADTSGMKVVCWQHNGYGASGYSQTYQSIRTNSYQVVNGKKGNITNQLFADILPAGSTIKKDIGSGLSITMPVALWGKEQATYPVTDTAGLMKQNKILQAQLPTSLTDDDLYVRLADIIITWNVFQHFHPYYREWITNWDQDLRQALADCYQNRTAADFEHTLKSFTAKMHDGHIFISNPAEATRGWLPLKWEWIEDQLVITHVLSASLALQPGDIVTAIQGIPVSKYISTASQTVAAGTPDALMERTLFEMAIGPKDSVLHLSLATAGNERREADISFILNGAAYFASLPQKEAYREIDSGTIYVNLSAMPWKEIEKRLEQLARAAVVLFDLRGYPKDENGVSILTHLIRQPENDEWMQLQQILLPDHEKTSWKSLGWHLQPAQPHIGGKVFFLTNGEAISYAESVMGYVKGLQLGTIVGEPTAGTNGDVIWVVLPGKCAFSFTGLKVINHDGSQHFMKGIQPDITVHKTIRGIVAKRDEVLEKALALSKKAE